ncbi:MAG: hypothetical protein CK530_00155 [Planctomycetaceae bacterium]|nr:MAG: hypothetical protein CK530_00155 [Planctomycetaceae bacterium]
MSITYAKTSRTIQQLKHRQSQPAPSKKSVRCERRRLIDPTTCERDYQPEEIEFMQAIEHYKRVNGRMFPTCSEMLEVLKSLGYVRATAAS